MESGGSGFPQNIYLMSEGVWCLTGLESEGVGNLESEGTWCQRESDSQRESGVRGRSLGADGGLESESLKSEGVWSQTVFRVKGSLTLRGNQESESGARLGLESEGV